jgi:hypothetical protein
MSAGIIYQLHMLGRDEGSEKLSALLIFVKKK